ncbi:MAG: condensation domain-containing protein [Pseudomonadota bacterium]
MATPSPSVATQERTLGASEILVHYLARHMVRLIEFDGPVQPELLKQAAERQVALRPMLRSRIVQPDPAQRPHFVLESELPPTFTVHERRGPGHCVEVFNQELNTPYDMSTDAVVRIHLLKNPDQGGEIILTCPHSACDGRSLFQFCTQLLDDYEALVRGEVRDLGPAKVSLNPSVEDVLPEELNARGEQLVADLLAKESQLPTILPWPSERGDSDAPMETRLVPFDLDAETVTRIRSNARAQGTTMHGVLGAAATLAADDVIKPPTDAHIGLTTTIDLRGNLAQPIPTEDLGIYAATLSTRHPDVKGMSRWHLARDVKQQVTDGMARDDHYTFVYIGELYVENTTSDDAPPMMTIALANLGALSLETGQSSLGLRSLRGALNLHPSTWPFISLNAVGINGRLAMTAVHQWPEISDAAANAYVSAMLSYLNWFADNPVDGG